MHLYLTKNPLRSRDNLSWPIIKRTSACFIDTIHKSADLRCTSFSADQQTYHTPQLSFNLLRAGTSSTPPTLSAFFFGLSSRVNEFQAPFAARSCIRPLVAQKRRYVDRKVHVASISSVVGSYQFLLTFFLRLDGCGNPSVLPRSRSGCSGKEKDIKRKRI